MLSAVTVDFFLSSAKVVTVDFLISIFLTKEVFVYALPIVDGHAVGFHLCFVSRSHLFPPRPLSRLRRSVDRRA